MTEQAPACPYCGESAELVGGLRIYLHRSDLAGLRFWLCAPCDAYVGCHKAGNGYGDGTRPLGRLANAELRKAKSAAHAAFDRLWLGGHMRRKQAYSWLAKQLDAKGPVHIGEMDVTDCGRVVAVSTYYMDMRKGE